MTSTGPPWASTARPGGPGRLPDLRQHAGELHARLLAARQLLVETCLVAAQTHAGQRGAGQPGVVRIGQPEADDLQHVEGEGQRRRLRQDPATLGQRPGRGARDVEPPEADGAAIPDLSGQGAQQRRLAGPVGTDDAGHRPGPGLEIDAVQDAGRPEMDGQGTGGKRHRSSTPRWRNRIRRNTGAPSTAVTIPIGSSDGAMIEREITSANSRSAAPRSAELTSRCR